jgi:hypothetical protein
MTKIDINGNTVSKNREKLIDEIKTFSPCKFEVQQWGRIRVYDDSSEFNPNVITFFADDEPEITDWLINNAEELT